MYFSTSSHRLVIPFSRYSISSVIVVSVFHGSISTWCGSCVVYLLLLRAALWCDDADADDDDYADGQMRRVGPSRTSWRPVTKWTTVSVAPTSDRDASTQSYMVDRLVLSSYYELEVLAFNDLDRSPSFTPPFIFFTHPGTSSLVLIACLCYS